MPQDAFTLKFIAEELDGLLSGGKVTKIVQPSKETLVFIIYTQKGSVKLESCLSAKGCRVNIAVGDTHAPAVAPAFCMLLRKHLLNARAVKVGILGFERVVYIDFERTSEFEFEKYRLYLEIMGKYSNAVLCENQIILGALKTTAISEETRRTLFTGVKYRPPAPQDKLDPDDEKGISLALENERGEAEKAISDLIRGVSYSTALEIVNEFGEKPTAKQIVGYLKSPEKSPCVVFSDCKPFDFRVRSLSNDKKEFDSLLDAQSYFYAYTVEKQTFEALKKRYLQILASAIKKVDKRLALINQKLSECDGAENIRLKGEILTANIYAVKRGDSFLEAVNYYSPDGQKIKIELDKTLSPSANAQRYYKKYAKLKRTATVCNGQKDEEEKKRDYLLSINSSVESAEKTDDLEEISTELTQLGLIKEEGKNSGKKIEKAAFREYLIDGFRVACGRNNMQNDALLKSASQNDLWLHAHGYHSSHVIIFCENEIPDGVIKAAAEICAYYSDGRGGSKVPVDYTRRKNVKKPRGANAGFVTYEGYSTALAVPDAHLKERIDND